MTLRSDLELHSRAIEYIASQHKLTYREAELRYVRMQLRDRLALEARIVARFAQQAGLRPTRKETQR